jgi:multidrug efflux pump subunit AcrB
VILGISVGMIYLALAVQFRSAVKPWIVFGAIPYGMVGAVAALWVMGAPFGFMAFLRIVSLVGVIVSHVIVLFDFIEEAGERGETLEDALLDTGIIRLRPVLITVGRPSLPWCRLRCTPAPCGSRCATRRSAGWPRPP